MNTTKKLLLKIAAFALLLGFGPGLLMPVEVHAATTKAQQQACQDKWQDSWKVDSTKDKNFMASDCRKAKGGNCTRTVSGTTAKVVCPVDSASTTTDPADTPATQKDTSAGCANVKTTFIKCDTSSKHGAIGGMLIWFINLLSIGIGIVAVGGIIWGAILYVTSNGDASKTKQGVAVITNTVIGLLLYVFAYAFMNFLIPGGLL